MPKPSLAELLTAAGYSTFTAELVARASNALYGNVGANADERDWAQIMRSSNPLAAAEVALRVQWQDPAYLLRNAAQLTAAGYPSFSPEYTYRQMSQRLTYTYSPAWSQGTSFAATSALSDEALNALAVSYEATLNTPTIGMNFSATSANLTFSPGRPSPPPG